MRVRYLVLMLFFLLSGRGQAQTLGWLDEPASGMRVRGEVAIAGWALDADSIGSVHVEWEQPGVASGVLRARYGVERPDVLAAYPAQPGAERSGFRLDLDTRQFMNGMLFLDVVVNRDHNRRAIGRTAVLVDNLHSAAPPAVGIDSPRRHQGLDGPFLLRGWVANADGVLGNAVFITVNGQRLTRCQEGSCDPVVAPFGFHRPDLRVAEGVASLASGGFETVFDPRGVLAIGMNRIGVEVIDAAGNSTIVERLIRYTGGAEAISPFGWIDFPAPAASVRDVLGVVGWGLDDTAVVEASLMSPEFTFRVPMLLGLPRLDVARVYEILSPPVESGFALSSSVEGLGPGSYPMYVRLVSRDGGAIDLPFRFTVGDMHADPATP